MSILYDNILRLCQKKGVTISKMCQECGFSKSFGTNLKNGQTSISSDTLLVMHEYFGVSVDEILGIKTATPEEVAMKYELERRIKTMYGAVRLLEEELKRMEKNG